MDVASAYRLVSRAIDSGFAAHGYLVTGDVGKSCMEFAGLVLGKLFPGAEDQIASRSHPDVFWLEPQGKSRTIKVARGKDDKGPGMRDGLIEPMSATSFSGGWKAGIIAGADRMQEEAANAFLKTLEEPTAKTIFLLLTDNPDAILPTIVSRTQRIDLPMGDGTLDSDAYDQVMDIMAKARGEIGSFARASLAEELLAVYACVKDEAPSEDVAAIRKAFFRTILKAVKGWMLDGSLKEWQVFYDIEAVEDAYRQCEKAINEETSVMFMMDRLRLPS